MYIWSASVDDEKPCMTSYIYIYIGICMYHATIIPRVLVCEGRAGFPSSFLNPGLLVRLV